MYVLIRRIMFTREVWSILIVLCSTGRSEDNVALNKQAEQNSVNNEWVASNAVDGCRNGDVYSDCCIHTAGGETEAWWRVDLGELMAVNDIAIYYRDQYQHRLAGYHLYLSNTTDSPTDGVLCYKDQSRNKADVQLVVTHECPYVARYVTVYNYRNDTTRRSWYNENAILELCEVEVYGCPIGMYGDGDCSSRCSAACYGGNCNSSSGACFYCFPGKYGEFCNNECPTNCKTNSCEKDSGFCIGCNEGFYGSDCYQLCSGNCKDRTCLQNNGTCTDCKDMFFGSTCNPCSTGCADPVCNKTTGNCYPCKAGFHGSKCDQSCPSTCANNTCFQNTGICADCVLGFYGNHCYQACSTNCKNGACDQSSGHCKECVAGLYGLDCTHNCPSNCLDECDRSAAECKACQVGHYGVTCDKNCSDQCMDVRCKQTDGHCEGCVDGNHGYFCSTVCPENCINNVCFQENGHCTDGCTVGFYNDHCDRGCLSTCLGNNCDQKTGSCTATLQAESSSITAVAIGIGTGFGLVIVVLVIVVIVLVRRLSRFQSENKTHDHVTNMSDLSRGEANKDVTYDEVPGQGAVEDNYERLDIDSEKRESSHVYQTT